MEGRGVELSRVRDATQAHGVRGPAGNGREALRPGDVAQHVQVRREGGLGGVRDAGRVVGDAGREVALRLGVHVEAFGRGVAEGWDRQHSAEGGW